MTRLLSEFLNLLAKSYLPESPRPPIFVHEVLFWIKISKKGTKFFVKTNPHDIKNSNMQKFASSLHLLFYWDIRVSTCTCRNSRHHCCNFCVILMWKSSQWLANKAVFLVTNWKPTIFYNSFSLFYWKDRQIENCFA